MLHLPVILVEITLPQGMRESFSSIRASYGSMMYNVCKIIKRQSPPLGELKDYIYYYNSSLKSKLDQCDDLSSVLYLVEREECSLVDIELLRAIVVVFDVTEAKKYIEEYKIVLKEHCQSMSLTLCLKEKFDAVKHLHCEIATYIFDWEPDEHKLKDVSAILGKSSGKLVKLVHIDSIHSVTITCSFPHSLTGALIISMIENLDTLIKNGLMKLTVGHCTIWKKQEIQVCGLMHV